MLNRLIASRLFGIDLRLPLRHHVDPTVQHCSFGIARRILQSEVRMHIPAAVHALLRLRFLRVLAISHRWHRIGAENVSLCCRWNWEQLKEKNVMPIYIVRWPDLSASL